MQKDHPQIKLWGVGALRVSTGYHFKNKIVSEGFVTYFNSTCDSCEQYLLRLIVLISTVNIEQIYLNKYYIFENKISCLNLLYPVFFSPFTIKENCSLYCEKNVHWNWI